MEASKLPEHLQRLYASGSSRWDTLSDTSDLPSVPNGFDINKFNHGRQFFQHNLFSCTLAMMLSLISGLTIRNLLDPLVFTKQSDTHHKSLRRYLQTFHHVLKWHFGNIWDHTTQAHISIKSVRCMHNSVRRAMRILEGSDAVRVSQYDMSLVQCGFMGCIVMYPEKMGIHCSNQDLSDYCYFWYGVGYLLGICDGNNICRGKLSETISICKEIEDYILVPAMHCPPHDFFPMAYAFVEGINLLFPFRLFSLEAFLALSYTTMSLPYPRLLFTDRLRFYFLRTLIFLVKYIPGTKTMMNKIIALGFDTKSIT